MTDTQLVIIGSGPAGYTAAVYAARANLSPVVIAGSVTAGGELMNTTDVENFPGFPAGVQGPELMESMREQAEKFGAEVIYDDVETLKLNPGAHEIETALGARYTAKAVILATGSAYRELGLPNEKKLSGHGVSWCATCDGFFFRDQHIAVIGSGPAGLAAAQHPRRRWRRLRRRGGDLPHPFRIQGHSRSPPAGAACFAGHAGSCERR